MTVDEFKKLEKGTRVYWRGDAPKQAGMRSQSLGTMDRWPACTMETCARIQRVPTRPPPVIREV